MTFEKDGYLVVRNLITKKEAISLGKHIGARKDGILHDIQLANTPAFYADEQMQRLQFDLLPKVEDYTGLDIFKTYTYARVYKKNDVLRIHKDRAACEISVTLDLGGDKWSIWVLDRDENPVEIKLNPGDGLLYRGCEILHWRGKFKGKSHKQVFVHYVDKHGPVAWAKDDMPR
jgi:hypothetical protein